MAFDPPMVVMPKKDAEWLTSFIYNEFSRILPTSILFGLQMSDISRYITSVIGFHHILPWFTRVLPPFYRYFHPFWS